MELVQKLQQACGWIRHVLNIVSPCGKDVAAKADMFGL
jgi:hypothetical protein